MKKGILFIFLIAAFSLKAQVVDTVSDIIGGCLGKNVDSLEVIFENDSIFISGILEANCGGTFYYLIRQINQDTITLIAFDNCPANCMCPLYFSTAIEDHFYDEYKLIIGYTCTSEPMIDYYFDSIIVRNTYGFQPDYEKRDRFNLYPNPTNDFINIELLNTTKIIDKIIIRDLTGSQKLFVKEKIDRNMIKLNLEMLNPGSYIIEIQLGKNKYYKQIIKI